jgi:putative resolvase
MSGGRYIGGKDIRKRFKISNSTLQHWADDGRIKSLRIGKENGKRLYCENDLDNVIPGYSTITNSKQSSSDIKKKVCYARVSSQKQKEDLARQITSLKEAYPGYDIVSDIGSGINWKRPGFNRILDEAMRGNVEEVVVAHRDRMCRFAFELVEHTLKNCGCKITIQPHQDLEVPKSDEVELRDDLLAIVTVFVASNNGKRAAAHRKERKRKLVEKGGGDSKTDCVEETAEKAPKRKRRKTGEDEDKTGCADEGKQVENSSDGGTEEITEIVD